MHKGILAKAAVTIEAPAARVWRALTTPEQIKKYMLGADTTTTWKVGEPISWKGEFEGKPFDDRGKILRFEPERLLEYTHFSSMSGQPDKPESYHTVTYDLSETDGKTQVDLSQGGNKDQKEADRSSKMWQMMLDGLKKTVESDRADRVSA